MIRKLRSFGLVAMTIAGLLFASGGCGGAGPSTGTAVFSPGNDGQNQLVITGPRDAYAITFNVIPRGAADKSPYELAGSSIPGDTLGSEGKRIRASYYPDKGRIESIALGKPVQLSKNMNMAAVAELPEDRSLLEQCGVYVILVKDKMTREELAKLVEAWGRSGP